MKINSRILPVLILATSASFFSCVKEAAPLLEPDNTTEVKTHAEDHGNVSAELDAIATEADIELESDIFFSGRVQRGQKTNNICGATIDADTSRDQKTITITYNGENCSGTNFRSGTVILSMSSGVHWKDAGATVTVNFRDLKIKRLRDNKSVTINGTETFTNVSGGLLKQLPTLQKITHTIASNNLSVTFEDGTQRTWQVARQRDFAFDNGVVLSVSGFGNSGNITNATEWGINRFGHAFVTTTLNPLVFKEDCGWRLTSGEIKHHGFATVTAIFGLSENGIPTTCPGTGKFYYKLFWTGPAGNSFSAILPY